jgi:hypothetical protein
MIITPATEFGPVLFDSAENYFNCGTVTFGPRLAPGKIAIFIERIYYEEYKEYVNKILTEHGVNYVGDEGIKFCDE